MKQSQLFYKTQKQAPKDEQIISSQLLIRGSFVDKTMAGVFSYLPLGFKVLKNIENIIREEMDNIGGQEMLMPSLQPKELWQTTDRWDNFDVLFKLHTETKKEVALGPTHEEIVTPLAQKIIFSYKDDIK